MLKFAIDEQKKFSENLRTWWISEIDQTNWSKIANRILDLTIQMQNQFKSEDQKWFSKPKLRGKFWVNFVTQKANDSYTKIRSKQFESCSDTNWWELLSRFEKTKLDLSDWRLRTRSVNINQISYW